MFGIVAIFTFVTICTSTMYSEFDTKQAFIPQSFSSEVEVLLISGKKLIDATINFDGPGNRVAIETLSEGAKIKTVINYDQDQVFEIDGVSCTSSPITDDNSYFPFNVDATTKKKTIRSAEDCLYFKNSKFFSEDITTDLPLLIFNITSAVPVRQYENAECKITHRFTKPEVTASTCVVDTCNATLFDITFQCEKAGIYHKFRFFKFQNFVDETVFQVPRGIHCDIKGGASFPDLPSFFTFSYDYTEEWVTDDAAKDFEVFYKDIAFDSTYKLLRLNNYDASGIGSIKIFDFFEGVGYSITPAMKQCEVGLVSKDIDLAEETRLPSNLFQIGSHTISSEPSYIGVRKELGLPFHVWTTLQKDGDFQVVKEIYFRKNLDGGKNSFLSHVVEYSYDVDEDGGTEIDKITFTPIRKMKSSPRDFTIFNVSLCYEDAKAFKKFQMVMEVVCNEGRIKCPKNQQFEQGTNIYESMMEGLHNELGKIGGLTITRISNLLVITSTNKELIVRGLLLESPSTISKNVPAVKHEFNFTATDAFNNIKTEVNNKGFTFFFPYENKMDIRYRATSFEYFDDKSDSKTKTTEQTANYSAGSMAGLGIIMTLVGIIIGVVGLSIYLKKKSANNLPTVKVQ